MKRTLPEMSRTEYENIIDEWIHSERDRQILRRRILDGISFESLAEEFDLSVPQTKRIVYKSQDMLLRHA